MQARNAILVVGITLTKMNALRKERNAECEVNKVILMSCAEVKKATLIAGLKEANHIESSNHNFAHGNILSLHLVLRTNICMQFHKIVHAHQWH